MSILDPVWTKPASVTKKTLDPLGLDRVSNRLTSDMLTGITVLTLRARYYSFYVWSIKNVNECEDINRYDDFRNAFFDRERVYSLACVGHEVSGKNPNGDHSNILGSVKSGPKWRNSGRKVNVRGFRHLGNRLGGYGYYYQASIGYLGLTKKEQIKDVLTPLGKKLAEAFEKAISKTDYYNRYIGKDAIPKSVLIEYGSRCCLCLLCEKKAPERDLLTEIMFGMNKEGVHSKLHENRRNTLSIILYDMHVLSKHQKELDEETFLDTTYFRQFETTKTVKSLSVPSQLEYAVDRWKMFRNHNFFAYSCESLFCAFLMTLDIHRTKGLSFLSFINLVDSPKLPQQLSSMLHEKITAKSSKEISLRNILLKLCSALTGKKFSKFDLNTSKDFDSLCTLSSRINENSLSSNLQSHFDSEVFDLHKVTALASLTLLTLYARFYWRLKTKNRSWAWLINRTESDLSPTRLVFQLEQKLSDPDYTFFDFMSWIFKDYVLTQAVSVYNQKVGTSLYSRPISWFHQDGKAYRIDRTPMKPRFRNSRFYSCANILSDLGLCDFVDDHYRVTAEGMHLLKKLGMAVQ